MDHMEGGREEGHVKHVKYESALRGEGPIKLHAESRC